MPTNPTTPYTNASIDRLTLGIDSLRGTEPAFPLACAACFEAEPAVGISLCMCAFFDAQSSSLYAINPGTCFEGE